MAVRAPAPRAAEERERRQRPPLESGDRLSRVEFHRRYALYPEIKKAELVEGVVVVGSPVHARHSEAHADFGAILGYFRAHTPGVRLADNQTVVLDEGNELQPDLCVRLEGGAGTLRRSEEGLYIGAPEFVVEVAASSASHDLHAKLDVYRRSGVQEYLVILAFEREMRFFRLEGGAYVSAEAGADGVIRSRVLPGFQFRPDWFWEGRLADLIRLVQEGIDSPEHAAFAAALAAA